MMDIQEHIFGQMQNVKIWYLTNISKLKKKKKCNVII